MPNILKAREYKILLNADKFPDAALLDKANEFWSLHLKPLIEHHPSFQDISAPAEGKFEKKGQRTIRYWDTQGCTLTNSYLTLRLRQQASERDELTLKLRRSDYVVVASAEMPGKAKNPDEVETKFEEDIAPLEIQQAAGGQTTIIMPQRRSTRSRFALSTSVAVNWGTSNRTIDDLRSVFPKIRKLIQAGADLSATLVAGPTVHERVFDGPKVVLSGRKAEFDLTIWNFQGDTGGEGGKPPRRIAEISFKYKTPEGQVSAKTAERGLDLFIAMQEKLGNWINPRHSSKTALALPSPCGAEPD